MANAARLLVLLAIPLLVTPTAWSTSDKPDLEGAVWVWSTTPNSTIPVEVNPHNRCGGASAGAFDVDVYIDDAFFERVHFTHLDPCSAWHKSTSADHTFPAGLHTLRIVVDPENVVDEADETNNEAVLLREFSAEKPDFVVQPTDARVESWPLARLVLDYEVCNAGDKAAGGAVTVRAALQDPWMGGDGYAGFGAAEHGPLDVGACETGTFEADALVPYGDYDYWLSVWQPYETPLRESDIRNNDARGTFVVGPFL